MISCAINYLVIDEVAIHFDHLIVFICLNSWLHLQKLVSLESHNFCPKHLFVEFQQVAQVVLSHARIPHHHVNDQCIFKTVESSNNKSGQLLQLDGISVKTVWEASALAGLPWASILRL